MIASTQITNAEIFTFIAVLVFKLLSIVWIRNFQDTFEIGKGSFVSDFSVYMTTPLKVH